MDWKKFCRDLSLALLIFVTLAGLVYVVTALTEGRKADDQAKLMQIESLKFEVKEFQKEVDKLQIQQVAMRRYQRELEIQSAYWQIRYWKMRAEIGGTTSGPYDELPQLPK